ncbi:unnamed protein product [Urochloa humidicola]
MKNMTLMGTLMMAWTRYSVYRTSCTASITKGILDALSAQPVSVNDGQSEFNKYKKYTSQKKKKKSYHSGQLHRRLGPLAAGPHLWDAWSPPARDARPLGRADPAAGGAAAPSRTGRLHQDARPAGRAATAAWGAPDLPRGCHR